MNTSLLSKMGRSREGVLFRRKAYSLARSASFLQASYKSPQGSLKDSLKTVCWGNTLCCNPSWNPCENPCFEFLQSMEFRLEEVLIIFWHADHGANPLPLAQGVIGSG